MATLRIGSRGSQLALWQANHISALLRARGHEVAIEIIHTTGDKITDVALAMVGTKGMFTKEIEEALAAGRVDLAVHSLKDLPTELPPGFEIAAITHREDPRDAFCSRLYSKVEDLPHGARVGTSSLRRQAQLKAIRSDLDIHPLRGNVDTRLRKLEQGEYDAIILAAAGLKRLGKTELIKQILPAEVMCPAAGQGALGIEIREGDGATRQHLEFLNDPAARATTTCERALLNSLGGGCQVPIGAYAEIRTSRSRQTASGKDREGHDFSRADDPAETRPALAAGVYLHLDAIVADPDGSKLLRESCDGNLDDPEALGNSVGKTLLSRGADEILEAVYGRGLAVPPQP
jgi:hydroxymethylbilane synthase